MRDIVRTLYTLSIWNNYLLLVMLRLKLLTLGLALTILRLDAPKQRYCVVFLGKMHLLLCVK